MENASKALIIAGAVLISILLISLGVMIYRNAADIANGNQMKDFEITAFNTKFSQYEGKKNGSQVKTLVQDCLSSNVNEENIDRLVSVWYSPNEDAAAATSAIDVDGGSAQKYSSATSGGSATSGWILGNNNTKNNQGDSVTMSDYNSPKSLNEIKNGTTYVVSMHYSTSGSNKGLVDAIIISKNS